MVGEDTNHIKLFLGVLSGYHSNLFERQLLIFRAVP